MTSTIKPNTTPAPSISVLLVAWLSPNRDREGRLDVFIDSSRKLSMPVLGRGSRGKSRISQYLKEGDTPTGRYLVTSWEPQGLRSTTSYGPHGVLVLKPIAGRALLANQAFNREELRIHGGDPNSARSKSHWKSTGTGDLHVTHGCLRVTDLDMLRLVDFIVTSGASMKNGDVTLMVRE